MIKQKKDKKMKKQLNFLLKTIFSNKLMLILFFINIFVFLTIVDADINKSYIISLNELVSFILLFGTLNLLTLLIYFIDIDYDEKYNLTDVGNLIILFFILNSLLLFITYKIFDVKIGTKNNKVFISQACLTKDNSNDKYIIINAKTYNYGNTLFKTEINKTLLIEFTDCLDAGNDILLKDTVQVNKKIVKVYINEDKDFECVKHEKVKKYVNFEETIEKFSCLREK